MRGKKSAEHVFPNSCDKRQNNKKFWRINEACWIKVIYIFTMIIRVEKAEKKDTQITKSQFFEELFHKCPTLSSEKTDNI